jgi:hypothetical protein
MSSALHAVIRVDSFTGHQVLNLDRTVLRDSPARTLITDLTDAGQVVTALAGTTVGQEFPAA